MSATRRPVCVLILFSTRQLCAAVHSSVVVLLDCTEIVFVFVLYLSCAVIVHLISFVECDWCGCFA